MLSLKHKLFLVLAFFLIFGDQFSKYIIRSQGGFYLCNKGIAFGIILPSWLTFIIITAIISFISLSILKYKFQAINLSTILIFSGTISNLIDRLRYGCVIDFIDLKIWPIFNLADSLIFFGSLFLIKKIINKNQN